MDRFFAEELPGPGSRVVLSPEETRHVKVRRVAAGEEVALFDGAGHVAAARFVGTERHGTRRRAAFDVIEVHPAPPDTETLVTVAVAIPKGRRMAGLVRECTEVGAWRIAPMVTERSVVRPARGERRERWARVAREAAKQSRRFHVPEILPAASFGEVLAESRDCDLSLIGGARPPYSAKAPEGSGGGSTPLREVLERAGRVPRVLLLVGPEGGFTEAEIARAASAGFVPVHLDGPVMRVETAAPVLVAVILFACS